jgi:hypothetical protein
VEQPTYTEEEIKEAIKYMNMVSTKAVFQLKEPEMQELIKMKSAAIRLIKKCEGYIFEIKEHIPAKDEA